MDRDRATSSRHFRHRNRVVSSCTAAATAALLLALIVDDRRRLFVRVVVVARPSLYQWSVSPPTVCRRRGRRAQTIGAAVRLPCALRRLAGGGRAGPARRESGASARRRGERASGGRVAMRIAQRNRIDAGSAAGSPLSSSWFIVI